MALLRNVLVLSLVSQVVLGQSSASEQTFSIQTDPATPTSSASGSASATPTGLAGMGLFPQECSDDCQPIASALTGCGLGDFTGFNVSCLCNTNVENAFVTCVDCAARADPNPEQAVGSYQSLLDAYIAQCAVASVTLSSASVDLSSTSKSSASSTSASGSSSSSAVSTTSASSAPTSSPASSTSASSGGVIASSASSVAASSSPSNPASRGIDQGWMWGLTGVGGVVVAAALGV